MARHHDTDYTGVPQFARSGVMDGIFWVMLAIALIGPAAAAAFS